MLGLAAGEVGRGEQLRGGAPEMFPDQLCFLTELVPEGLAAVCVGVFWALMAA